MIDTQNIVQMTSAKFEKDFCKKLPDSLQVLSKIVYSEGSSADPSAYAWIPPFAEDISLNQI